MKMKVRKEFDITLTASELNALHNILAVYYGNKNKDERYQKSSEKHKQLCRTIASKLQELANDEVIYP